jgi:hypothetical protein
MDKDDSTLPRRYAKAGQRSKERMFDALLKL